jgi:phosphatidate cytidylyltransferase
VKQLNKRLFTSLILLFLIAASLNYLIMLLLLIILISIFALIEFNSLFKKIYKNENFFHFISIILSLTYLLFFSLIIWNYIFPFEIAQKISLIFLLLICISTDVGGYIFGKTLGGKKFTKISPNKTYSGILGSFILSIVFGSFFYLKFGEFLILNQHYIIFIFVISLISQLGDLSISYIKRRAKIKDTGSILPGHGGVLDRIDGILFAIPIGIILLST